MSRTIHVQLLEALRDNLWQVQEEAGDDWERFRDPLISLLSSMLREKDSHNTEDILAQIRVLLAEFQLPAAITNLLRPPPGGAYRAPELSDQETPLPRFEPADVARGHLSDTFRGFESQPETTTDAFRRDILTMGQALLSDLKATEPKEKKDVPRHFNTFLTGPDAQSIMGEDQVLLRDHVYSLCVEISPEQRGPGDDNDIFVDGALAEVRKKVKNISLLVVAASRDFDIKPQVRTIDLPPEGPSSMARFSLRPRFAGKRGLLQVEIFCEGHLLQSKRVKAFAVAAVGDEVSPTLRPTQTARITFTTTDRFASDTISLIPERVLTIDVERDERDGSVDLRFLDRTRGEEELAYYDTTLEPQALGEAIAAVREQLATMAQEGPGKWNTRSRDQGAARIIQTISTPRAYRVIVRSRRELPEQFAPGTAAGEHLCQGRGKSELEDRMQQRARRLVVSLAPLPDLWRR